MSAAAEIHPFTSDLTIDELLLLEDVGFEPLELVLGASYFHIGYPSAPYSQNQELVEMSQVMLLARQTAMAEIQNQAHALGADGVVGMRIEIEREGHHAEFSAMGTAVRRRAGDGAKFRDRHGRAFTCDLSGADFWGLVRGGFRPVALVHGVCVYHVAHQGLGAWFKTAQKNCEMPAFSQGLYDARELALSRVQLDAASAGATGGIVGVEVREGHYGWHSHVLEFVAVGSAVSPIEDTTHELHAEARAVLSMRDD
ncbi:MAG TPA: heavy metal-binding domain-containing protein [Polyangiaceae bacterium]|nr:heavy metal-binding domain-containing protein [Polyangiaceae bacterium]